MESSVPIYGLMAEFKEADEVLEAATRAREAGYRRMDAYTPFPVHGLSEAIGFKDSLLPWLIFFAGVTGMVTGYLLLYGTLTPVLDPLAPLLNSIAPGLVGYAYNSGGRPFHSWPQFIPITFEMTILFAAFGAVVGMLGLNGLPRPYQSVFNAPGFERASNDRFFLCIEARDPLFDVDKTSRFLREMGAETVSEVEP